MIAADDKDLSAIVHKPGHKAIKQSHGLRLGSGALIDVACNEDSINLFIIGNMDDLIKNSFLIIQEQQVIHLLAKMQICNMKESHGTTPLSGMITVCIL